MKKVLIAGVIALTPVATQAQDIVPFQGFYLGFGGGADWALGTPPTGVSTWTGWAVGGKAGYDFVGPRVELEVGYGQISTSANIPGTAIIGKVGSLNVMANVLYDFMPASMITPYIGAGAGVAFVDSNASLGSTQFAYQAMLGLAANVNNSMRIMVEGRYLGTTNPSVNVAGRGHRQLPEPEHPRPAGRAVQVRRARRPPPPPPPPAVAPPSFMVFFDWDRSNLSQQALDTIKQAADAFKTRGNARITATGHTDTSGPEAYNMALSLRRANAVKDALVREGVPAQAITRDRPRRAGPAGADRRRRARAAEPPRRDRHPVSDPRRKSSGTAGLCPAVSVCRLDRRHADLRSPARAGDRPSPTTTMAIMMPVSERHRPESDATVAWPNAARNPSIGRMQGSAEGHEI